MKTTKDERAKHMVVRLFMWCVVFLAFSGLLNALGQCVR